MTTDPTRAAEITRPIIGIENRTAQEVFDMMSDRFRGYLASLRPATPSPVTDGTAQSGEAWERLRKLSEKAAPGPWEVETEPNEDGEYGAGPDPSRGYDDFMILAAEGGKILGTENATHKSIEEDGPDEYGDVGAWDAIGKSNAELLVACVNFVRAALASTPQPASAETDGDISAVWKQAEENHRLYSDTGSCERDIQFLALGLAGEAGEVANFVKKRWRDGDGHDEDICKEIADVCAYAFMLASTMGMAPADLIKTIAYKQQVFLTKMAATRQSAKGGE